MMTFKQLKRGTEGGCLPIVSCTHETNPPLINTFLFFY